MYNKHNFYNRIFYYTMIIKIELPSLLG